MHTIRPKSVGGCRPICAREYLSETKMAGIIPVDVTYLWKELGIIDRNPVEVSRTTNFITNAGKMFTFWCKRSD